MKNGVVPNKSVRNWKKIFCKQNPQFGNKKSFLSLINFYFYLKRHAIPGSIDQSRECYETIAKQHPQVIYVIHILPSKDSLEYQILKEHTLAGALVGQGFSFVLVK